MDATAASAALTLVVAFAQRCLLFHPPTTASQHGLPTSYALRPVSRPSTAALALSSTCCLQHTPTYIDRHCHETVFFLYSSLQPGSPAGRPRCQFRP